MNISCLSSGSVGNCYILTEPKTKEFIILDCGIKFETITHSKVFTGFKDCRCVLTTHEHGDHSSSLDKFEMSGVDTLTYKTLQPQIERHYFGDWTIISFPLQHNVPNWGFVIQNINEPNEKYCYVTDFFGMPRIEGITRWLMEVNYIDELIEQMIEEEKFDFMKTGFKYHNSLEKTIEYFTNKILTRPKTIIACHVSQNNGVKNLIKKELIPLADEVIIAEGGIEWKREAN